MQTLYSVVLNLNSQLSHPTYRDMLKVIRILVHMIRSVGLYRDYLLQLIKELPHEDIREYSE